MEKKFHTIKQKQNGLMPQNLKATSWQDGKRVHCKYLPLSHTKP